MEKLIHAEGNDVVFRYVLSDAEIEFMFVVAEAENLELAVGDRSRFADLFESGLLEFDEYSSGKYGGAYLRDVGRDVIEALDR